MEEKVKFRDRLKDFAKNTLGTELGHLSPAKQSKAMARLYVTQIVKTFTPGAIPSDEEDLDNCVIDGSDDCGVDFLARAEGSVLIIQAKCRGYGKHEKIDDFTSFCEVLKRLHPITGAGYKKNQKLVEAIGDIDWDNDYFDLRYITLGRVGSNIKTREKEGLTLSAGIRSLSDRNDFVLCDETELNIQLREALSAGETITHPVAIRLSATDGNPPWLEYEAHGKRRVYVGFAKGSEIAEIYRPHRFRLFAMNIRDWIGDTVTNKGIVDTAIDRPDDFLFFNNGISAVATSIEKDFDNGILQCRNFSIINGAQTVRSLFKAQSKNPESVRNSCVMIRISTFSLGKEPQFLEEVTRYNNTQNKVAVSDFRSNDPVQRDLAMRFSTLKRGGQRFWYKNKRSRERSGRVAIEMEEFAKTIHSFKFGPHDMWGGTARLFDSGSDGRYAFVFGDGDTVWTTVPEEEFQLLCGMWFVCEEVRQVWKDEKGRRPKDRATGLALERRYMVYWAVGELLRMVYARRGKDLQGDLRILANPKWAERDGPEKSAIREIADLAFTGLAKAYETVSLAREFRHRNWFREKDYLEGIRTELRFIQEIKGAEWMPSLSSIPRSAAS